MSRSSQDAFSTQQTNTVAPEGDDHSPCPVASIKQRLARLEQSGSPAVQKHLAVIERQIVRAEAKCELLRAA